MSDQRARICTFASINKYVYATRIYRVRIVILSLSAIRISCKKEFHSRNKVKIARTASEKRGWVSIYK